ncbi:hypothetical protein K7X08_007812 [Anisodus acutangulus]|uniref:Uncharacterized protein n=1 Tax=Anisodus acutangulus TaxID=402998 RepID=A0A9Q1RNS0_9SOLA|nr:hypothetical protein K7X08_007812 [Anisodus acutangulus]
MIDFFLYQNQSSYIVEKSLLASVDGGDDVVILGLAVDKVSLNGEIKLLVGEEEKEVSPCCLLLCLTNDGRLAIFHFASAIAGSASPQSTDFEEKNDTFIVASSQDVLVESSSARKQINQVDSGIQPHEMDRDHKIVSTSAQSSAAVKFSSEEAIKTTNQVTEPLIRERAISSEKQRYFL